MGRCFSGFCTTGCSFRERPQRKCDHRCFSSTQHPKRWGSVIPSAPGRPPSLGWLPQSRAEAQGPPGPRNLGSAPGAEAQRQLSAFRAGLEHGRGTPRSWAQKVIGRSAQHYGRAARLSHQQTMLARHRTPTKKHSISLNKPGTDLMAPAPIEMRGFLQRKERWQLKP